MQILANSKKNKFQKTFKFKKHLNSNVKVKKTCLRMNCYDAKHRHD
jgi:hypothetical protein